MRWLHRHNRPSSPDLRFRNLPRGPRIPNSAQPSLQAHPLRGYFYIAGAAFLWGVSAILGRAAFTGRLPLLGLSPRPIDPLILAQSRTTFSVLILLPALMASRGRSGIELPRRDLVRCVVLGVLGVAASNYLYYVAIQKTNVATAIIVQYTAPVWVLLYVVARGQQRFSLQKIVAVALAITGLALVIGVIGMTGTKQTGALRLDSYGLLAALLAAFSFAFYNVGGHDILARHDRWRVLVWVLGSAAAFWLVVNPPWKIVAAHFTASQWLFLFIFSMVSVLVPFSLYFHGLQHLEPTRAIVASCLEPVFSVVLAATLLGEVLRPMQALGILLVLAAILIVQLGGPDHPTDPLIVQPIE